MQTAHLMKYLALALYAYLLISNGTDKCYGEHSLFSDQNLKQTDPNYFFMHSFLSVMYCIIKNTFSLCKFQHF